LGSSHAIALTCATSSGGKTARTTRPRFIRETRQTPLGKPTSPPTDRLRAHPQPPTDLGIAMTLASKQHQLRSQHLTMRAGVTRGAMLKLLALGLLEDDLLGDWTWHRQPDSPPQL
jgi:hypothetical protein